MKFSTETLAEITTLMVSDFERQIREGVAPQKTVEG
jgi:hypothetical protein